MPKLIHWRKNTKNPPEGACGSKGDSYGLNTLFYNSYHILLEANRDYPLHTTPCSDCAEIHAQLKTDMME